MDKTAVIRAFDSIVNSIVSLTNKNLDIAQLQEKYRATKGKIIQGRLTDVNRVFYLQMKDGRIHRLKNPGHIDGYFETTIPTMINIFRGRIKAVHPGTMQECMIDYTPLDAIRFGDAKVWGDASSTDILLGATAVYKEIYPKLRDTINTAIERKCLSS